MSSIFISHSSHDNAIAEELTRRLTEKGYHSVFLDFDPGLGIPAGRDWEKELYSQLRACRAVIVVFSKHWLDSRWCFAELTHAKALGKSIVAIRTDESLMDGLIGGAQAINAVAGWDDAYARLWRGLQVAGLDPNEPLAWVPTRPPYPGLIAFQEADAAVFFGRGPEIRAGLDLLNQLQRFGGPRLVLMLGASGSGKSSVVRAGVLPRLRHDRDAWLVLPVVRPLNHPFSELAKALAAAFRDLPSPRDRESLLATLMDAADDPEAAARRMREVLDDLCEQAGRPGATVLLTLDQAEELVVDTSAEEVSRFLPMLSVLLSSSESRLLVLATVRSDLLGTWQQEPALRGLPFESLLVGPMSDDCIAEVIIGPAQVAGIELEAGLVPAIVSDTGTADALPLLAFTLRELWERGGEDRVLRLQEYREELGGLAGSIARAAESVLRAHVAATGRGAIDGQVHLSPEDESVLRAAFLSMVRIDDEGRYARQPARCDELSVPTRELVERFVAARLLVPRADGQEMEVRHEALFRAWDRLAGWLQEGREFLTWRRRLQERLQEWERRSRSDQDSLLRGAPLAEAAGWLARPIVPLSEAEQDFIAESVRVDQTRRRKRRLTRASLALGLLMVAILGAVVMRERARRELLQSVAILNAAMEAEDPLVRALLLTELNGRREPPNVLSIAHKVLDAPFPAALLRGHTGAVTAAAWSPDGALIATISDDSTARVWRSDGTGDPVVLRGHRGVLHALAFSPDGSRVATASEDGTVRVWRAREGGEPLVLAGHEGGIWDLSFDPAGRRLVTAAEDGLVRVWSVDRLREPLVLGSVGSAVLSVAFSPRGDRVASATADGAVQVWPSNGQGTPVLLGRHDDAVDQVEFSRDGSRILTRSLDGTARVWMSAQPASSRVVGPEEGSVLSARFSPDGSRVVTAAQDGTVGVWTATGGGVSQDLGGHHGSVWDVAFSPDGLQVITASEDSTARVWWLRDSTDVTVLRGHGGAVLSSVFSPDGARAVTTSADGTARVWYVDGRGEPEMFRAGVVPFSAVAIDAQASRVVAGAADGAVRVWSLDRSERPVALAAGGGRVWDVEFSPNGSRVAWALDDKRASIQHVDGRGQPVVLAGHGGPVQTLSWNADGSRLLTASDDGTARLWRGEDGAEIQTFSGHSGGVRGAVFSPDGARVLTASADGNARLWRSDGTGEAIILRGHTAPLFTAGFDAAGDRVVSASQDGTSRVWSASGGENVAVLSGHDGWVRSAGFSPDGSRVVTASQDGTARVWRVDGEGESTLLARHGGPVRDAFFTPDGLRVLTSADDGTARVQAVDRGSEPIVLGGRGPMRQAAMSLDGSRLATISDDELVVRVWRIEWPGLLAHLLRSTSACLSAEERMWLLDRPQDAARSEFAACERAQGRSAAPVAGRG